MEPTAENPFGPSSLPQVLSECSPSSTTPTKVKELHPSGDMVLILKDGSKLRVHSTVLAASSRVFATVFHIHPLEYRDDHSVPAMRLMLPADDPEAMTTLCTALHHEHNTIEGEVPSSDQLREIALLVEKYLCRAEALRPVIDRWLLEALKHAGSNGDGDKDPLQQYGDMLAYARLLDNPALFYGCSKDIKLFYAADLTCFDTTATPTTITEDVDLTSNLDTDMPSTTTTTTTTTTHPDLDTQLAAALTTATRVAHKALNKTLRRLILHSLSGQTYAPYTCARFVKNGHRKCVVIAFARVAREATGQLLQQPFLLLSPDILLTQSRLGNLRKLEDRYAAAPYAPLCELVAACKAEKCIGPLRKVAKKYLCHECFVRFPASYIKRIFESTMTKALDKVVGTCLDCVGEDGKKVDGKVVRKCRRLHRD